MLTFLMRERNLSNLEGGRNEHSKAGTKAESGCAEGSESPTQSRTADSTCRILEMVANRVQESALFINYERSRFEYMRTRIANTSHPNYSAHTE